MKSAKSDTRKVTIPCNSNIKYRHLLYDQSDINPGFFLRDLMEFHLYDR